MKKYAVLNVDNMVTNIVVADSLESAEKVTSCNCVFVDNENVPLNIGKLYSNGEFIDPPVEETP